MPGTTTSAALYGIDARPVTVEVDVHGGLPNVTVVGLPDAAVQEARERIRSAIKNSGAQFPTTKVTISLSPADWRKEGSGFDLPVAIALLIATSQVPDVFTQTLLVGELNLAGAVKPTTGILAIAELARTMKLKLIVPAANAAEARLVSGIDVIPINSLGQLIDLAYQPQPWYLGPVESAPPVPAKAWTVWPTIVGQTMAKRAAVIAAAGGHNVFFVGPPGSGKTLLARGLHELLPPMTESESLAVTKIHSVGGKLNLHQPLVAERPFRQPHHTASVASLVGGGRIPKPGELSYAHRGLLFMDEFAEFSREHIEALRQPLEDGVVTVSRVAGSAQFPAAGMLVAAMNPCPCGFLHDRLRTCTCTASQLRRYAQRISGPILDRFDLFVSVPRVPAKDLTAATSTEDPRPGIVAARKRQRDRVSDQTNSQLRGPELNRVCRLGASERALLEQAMERMHLSMRAYHRILRVSRTIADLAGAEVIDQQHIAEALQFRPPASLSSLYG